MKHLIHSLRLAALSIAAALAGSAQAAVPFETATSADDPDAKSYYIYETGNGVYVKYNDPNVLPNTFTGDKFVFIESTALPGTYYIYDRSAGLYIYYVAETSSSNASQQASSVVRVTADQSVANTWRIVDDGDGESFDIVPGTVSSVSTTTQGWNFRGGTSCVLNLYDRSDRNSHWQFLGQTSSSMACATHVFSLPDTPFMHKLVCNEGDQVVSVDGLPAGIELYSDRPAYKYLRGTAPATPGTYTYTVNLQTADGQSNAVDVTFDVSDQLTQPTPFMGILTWNAFQNNINTAVIEQISDALVDYGLVDLGYNYMCIDDQWAQRSRSADGKLMVNTSKFDADLNALTDYVHKNGQRIGIYSDAGSYTCSGAQPGSYGYELSDARQFVGWGFDLLKYDFCNATGGSSAPAAQKAYAAMGSALDQAMTEAGRDPKDFLFYMCEWGYRAPWLWAAETGATCWRSTDDTRDYWSDVTYKGGIMQSIGVFKTIWPYQGVNRWNDADMLVVGLHGTGYSSNDGGGAGYAAGLTLDEARTNFALWCMWSSPLTLSNNITNLDGQPNTLTGKTVTNTDYAADLDIIRNADLIALDQDALGQSGEPILDTSYFIVFAKDLADGDVALSITNLSAGTRTASIDLSTVPGLKAGETYYALDLWDNAQSIGEFTTADVLRRSVRKHMTNVYRLRSTSAAPYRPADGVQSPRTDVNPNQRGAAYDLQGRRVSADHAGITIAPDGSKRVK